VLPQAVIGINFWLLENTNKMKTPIVPSKIGTQKLPDCYNDLNASKPILDNNVLNY
jgi:hypothetical protein